MSNLTLESEKDTIAQTFTMEFKVSGLASFTLELEEGATVRDVKKLAQQECNIAPEHMRLIHKGTELQSADVLDSEMAETAVQVLFTAGHTGLVGGGSQARSGGSTGQPGAVLRGQREVPKDPFRLPVRGPAGSKGNRVSRVSARRGGMGMIRKYDIMMKRQEFRELAKSMGWTKFS